MTTAYIKDTLIEKVKRMNSREAKKTFALLMEHNVTDTFYNSFNDIPAEHKLSLEKGIDDFKKGKKSNAADFIKNIKNKYV